MEAVLKDLIKKYIIEKIFKGTLGGIRLLIFEKLYGVIFENLVKPLFIYLETEIKEARRKRENAEEVKDVKDAKTDDEISDSFGNLG